MKLRYDLIGASQHGELRHPAEVLKSLRISYRQYEGAPIADCIFLHGAMLTVDYLPPFIEVVDAAPTVDRTLSDSYQMRGYAATRLAEFLEGVRSCAFHCRAASLDTAGFESLSFETDNGEKFAVRIPERKS